MHYIVETFPPDEVELSRSLRVCYLRLRLFHGLMMIP